MPNPSPSSNKSSIAVLALMLLIVAAGIALVSIFVPVIGPAAIVTALGAVTLAVLSLREDR
jgi:CHASE2 domain-containing sensor protein